MGDKVTKRTYWQHPDTGELGITEKGQALPEGVTVLKSKKEHDELLEKQKAAGQPDPAAAGDEQGGETETETKDPDGAPDNEEPDPAPAPAGETNADGLVPGQEVSFEELQRHRGTQRRVWERAKQAKREEDLARELKKLGR